MLSSVLHSEVAVEINISIMRAFVAVRQLIANPPIDKVSLLQREVKELRKSLPTRTTSTKIPAYKSN